MKRIFQGPRTTTLLAQPRLAADRSHQGRGVKPDISSTGQPGGDLWIGWTGRVAHPAAPAGGGGPGFFRPAGPTGSESDFATPVPHPESSAARLVDPIALLDKAEALADPPAKAAPEIMQDETKKVAGVDLTIKKDENNIAGIEGAETKLDLKAVVPGYDHDDKNVVTKIKETTPVKGTILTKYGKGSAPNDLSAYGRGTTKADKAAGNITLGFHESCHREDYLTYLTNNPIPTFGGKVGMSVTDFKAAGANYIAAINKYLDAAMDKSDDDTDEVGNPTKSAYFNSP